ncbi:aromatic amino acid aminotransferase [Ureibacillus massiliensis 4400831 = CIP 108448 = CCUG 49529]|uniref:Aminotransferase n=1 Tax=Ureibacillus massiliensis 4400831 = CIP 108448 = CCUG 49529 TaxID=1211035 RepID=A0A0A3J3U3_9BACL|nr:aminotransferase A [Ureibacillus massiliensis]KGR91616.1 aromatic amino acid aminotransferase [Ureibacillus massiliensis 4400831 = CIP 108448 = CCUG 49529]
MNELLNKTLVEIEESGIRKIANLANEIPDVVNLTVGQPDFPSPSYIKDAGIRAIQDEKHGYTTNNGLKELRELASEYVQNLYGLSYNPQDEVIVTVGASEALDLAFRTILSPGTEVILPAPSYPGYEPLIRLCNAVPVFVDTSNTGFKLTASLIEEHITEKTRCIVLPYPSNPTGTVLSKEEINEIGQLLKDKNIFIVSDEIYSELVYEDKHYSIAAYPGLKDKTIVINGVSKSHSMTGWRIGFTFAPPYITKQMHKLHSFNVVCATSISQFAAIEALKHGTNDEEVLAMKNEYNKRRDYVYKRLIDMGLQVAYPKGAFYIFPSIKKYGLSSEDFALKLLREAKVAATPGSAFTEYGEGYIRLSYASSMEELKKGLDRLEYYLSNFSSINI